MRKLLSLVILGPPTSRVYIMVALTWGPLPPRPLAVDPPLDLLWLLRQEPPLKNREAAFSFPGEREARAGRRIRAVEQDNCLYFSFTFLSSYPNLLRCLCVSGVARHLLGSPWCGWKMALKTQSNSMEVLQPISRSPPSAWSISMCAERRGRDGFNYVEDSHGKEIRRVPCSPQGWKRIDGWKFSEMRSNQCWSTVGCEVLGLQR